MVNMNAADDKQSCNKPNKINRTNGDTVACSSKICTSTENSEVLPQKLNGTSQQSINCNKHPITNGAFSRVNPVPCGVTSCSGSAGPSSAVKHSIPASNGNPENGQSTDENGSLPRNSIIGDSDGRTKENHRAAVDYDGCSSSEDEECCIYTYKGDSNQMADLPSTFFRLDLMPFRPNGDSRDSSPDMDYLEMDFDPGPSNDHYSSESSECVEEIEEERLAVEALMIEVPVERDPTPEVDVNPPTPLSPLSTPSPVWGPRPQSSHQQDPCPPGLLWSPPLSPGQPPQTVEATETETQQPSYCYCIANKLASICIDENFNEGDAGTMVWKDQEAREKQVSQIGVSACGATAVINTLLALDVPFSTSSVKLHVATRLRAESAPLVEYLMSRSNAGATHVDLIRGLHSVSQDLVYARFFHMYPQRSISLVSWLSHWIRRGAVPIVTVNPQRGLRAGGGEQVPDAWHHQMVHGVSARGVHLTNPLEVQTEARLWPQLASPSELRVRRDDVVSRWTPDTLLHPLIHPSLPLWRRLNVLGQVVNVVRESHGGGSSSRSQPTAHVTIPASYSSGVTIVLLRTNSAYDELRLAPELPVDPFAYTSTSR
uniref:Uncharacterized protein n=1 Tax=Graphocephala atropunctata TaxID=36148 RepID=A0A1B6MG20_9HEMI